MKKLLILPLLTLFLGLTAFSQCDRLAKECNNALKPFLPNGQYLRKYVKEGQIVSLRTTLFEGFKYRIVAQAESDDGGKVLYRIVDGGRQTIFSNKSVMSSKYWDLEIGATDNFIFQAKLTKGSGCLVLTIGFDDSMLGDDDEEDLDDLDDLDDIDDLDLDDLDVDMDDVDLDDDLDLDLDDPIFEDEDDLFDE